MLLDIFQVDQLQNDIREKDILIHQKSKMTKQLSEELAQRTNEIDILRKSVENLREQVRNFNEIQVLCVFKSLVLGGAARLLGLCGVDPRPYP